MKKNSMLSITVSTLLTSVVLFTGCFNDSTSSVDNGGSQGNSSGGQNANTQNSAYIHIATENGTRNSVNPVVGGTVVIRNNNDGTNNVATVVHGELNECANQTSDDDNDGVVCGPKKGVTYVFQADFGKLGPIDNNKSTPDGGVLLFDALTAYNGMTYPTPVEGNQSENRIQEVYIPANYIVLSDAAKQGTVDQKYEIMREYLANVANMQFLIDENNLPESNNPFFGGGKEKGRFVATFVMWFTRGYGEDYLKRQFDNGDNSLLEYLAVEFELDVERVDNNSSKLKFSSPAGSDVVFVGKKAGDTGRIVQTTNNAFHSLLHVSHDYVYPSFSINVAKYFEKLIEKGDNMGVGDFAKEILVENAQHPWPVKIYGTLHEITGDNPRTYDRSFVRNPGKMDAELFNLTTNGIAYSNAYNADPHRSAVQAMKFNIVYPGGQYNKLED